MSEIIIAEIKTRIEEIKEDITDLKSSYKEVVNIISKLSYVDDKFQANDDGHRLMWEEIKCLRSIINSNEYVTKSDIRTMGVILTIIFSIISFISSLAATFISKAQ